MKEFNLSEKIDEVLSVQKQGIARVLHEEDVKEFIRRLKEITGLYKHEGMCKLCKEETMVDYNSDCDNCKIDKLCGEELI